MIASSKADSFGLKTGTLISMHDMQKIIKKANIFVVQILVDEEYY